MVATRQALVGELGRAMQAYQRVTQSFDDEVGRQLGLNPTDLRCLDWLVDARRSARELSSATGLSSAATTTLIDRLERKGFVRRVPHDRDRRQVLVEMTDEGRARTMRFYGPLVSEGVEMLGRYSKAELEAMHHYLLAITELTDRHRAALRGAAGSPP
jgi:DNA-binding MarR family transcriptional regulator